MDQLIELADQRLHPSPLDGASGVRAVAPTVSGGSSALVADLPALLLAVLPLVQAIDWLESASASTLQNLASLSSPAIDQASVPIEVPTTPAPLLTEQMIEQALSNIDSAAHHTAGSALVYAADIQPLNLTIAVEDLFSDAGALSEVTPRVSTASFVSNVENDIFGREMNVAETPLQAPDKSVGGPSAGVLPIDETGGTNTDPVGGGPDATASTNGDGLIAYGDREGPGTFLLVDNAPDPLPKTSDIIP